MRSTVSNDMDDTGEAILHEILSNSDDAPSNRGIATAAQSPPGESIAPTEPKSSSENHAQWAVGGNSKFIPIGSTIPILTAGVYEAFAQPGAWGVEKLEVASDNIYILPDMATQTIMDEAQKFWSSEDKYRTHKLLYKRGILLWGPPGGGKTVAVKMLINELVKRDGIVLLVSNVNLSIVVLKAIRRIEPKRNLIVVFEDIDEIINYNGEASVLSMLDGENNIDNILHIATTNYPDKLGARIINRPSRFDRRVRVGMPTSAARRAYLEQATKDGLTSEQLDKWTLDTEDMSIAHLRELVAAVYCLDQPYTDVVERLKKMAAPVKADRDGFRSNEMGFQKTAQAFTINQ